NNDLETSDISPRYEHISSDGSASSSFKTRSSSYKTTVSKNIDKSGTDIKNNKSTSEDNVPFPAVEAVQRFYQTNNNQNNTVYVSDQIVGKKLIPITNLDDNFEYIKESTHVPSTNNDKNSLNSIPNTNTNDTSKRFDLPKIDEVGDPASKSKSKSSAGVVEQEVNNSEFDDTLNDIEDYIDQGNKESAHTSNENSPTSTQHGVISTIIKPTQETRTSDK
ncbi:unnamed protein product, partial [Didymodactylos carnosus]